ncbi:MAG: hypothetical protein JST16_04530 [Bdellovibrionales bacterium]|nr:hypothetical protein [Bdellovibrionales bacterium]
MKYIGLATAVVLFHSALGAFTAHAAAAWPTACAADFDRYQLAYYQQDRYQLVDPMGDLALYKMKLDGKVAPARTVPSDEDQKNFLRALTQILREELNERGLVPRLGRAHAWSSRYRHCDTAAPRAPKIWLAIAAGVTARYAVTGNEAELLEFVLDQGDRSVLPADLFRQAYRLSRGDVYLALLTVQNLLGRAWDEPDRETEKLSQKLATPEIPRSAPWNNLFGHLLLTYVENNRMGGELRATLQRFQN